MGNPLLGLSHPSAAIFAGSEPDELSEYGGEMLARGKPEVKSQFCHRGVGRKQQLSRLRDALPQRVLHAGEANLLPECRLEIGL